MYNYILLGFETPAFFSCIQTTSLCSLLPGTISMGGNVELCSVSTTAMDWEFTGVFNNDTNHLLHLIFAALYL